MKWPQSASQKAAYLGTRPEVAENMQATMNVPFSVEDMLMPHQVDGQRGGQLYSVKILHGGSGRRY